MTDSYATGSSRARGTEREPLSDSKARESALDPQRSFIVQAPAGSGKTGLLVYRILRLLAVSEQPESVLAITFTRKATFEMRERLMSLLQRAEAGESASDDFEQLGLDLANKALAQDKRMGWNLLDTPRRLQIQTIDALSLKLVSAMPWLSRLGAQPNASDQASDLYEAAIEQFLVDELTGDTPNEHVQRILQELDFNYFRIRTLFSTMLGKRDQWLRHLVSNSIEETKAELAQSWQLVTDSQIERVLDALGPDLVSKLKYLAEFSWNNLVASDRLPAELVEVGPPTDSLVALCQMMCFLLFTKEKALKFRVQKNVTLGFPPGSDEQKDLLQAVIDQLSDDETATETIFEFRFIPTRPFSEDEWQRLLDLEAVLKQLAAYLQLQFRARGKSDHSEVTQRANLALHELEGPTDLALKLDYQINHILVDEFQDTSFSQIELLKRLTLGWSSENDPGAKTLFLVGDPMQSIYRFREAEVGLFLDVWNNAQTKVFSDIEIEPLLLSQNFRSSGNLVKWFNTTFSQSFPTRSNSLTGAVQYASATTSKPETDAQSVDYLLANNADSEALLVLDSVRAALADSRDGKVAILIRSRGHVARVLPLLEQAGIAYQGLDLFPLNQAPAVIDVISLARALSKHEDRIAWLALLRGPWVGLTLAQIQAICPDPHLPVIEQLQQQAKNVLADGDLVRLQRFLTVMLRAIAQHQQVELGVLTQWTWQQLGGENTLFGVSRNSIESVFQLIDEHQIGGELTSLTKLQAAIDSRYTTPDVEDANPARVVITTMHKAKGLEFDTVILPCLAQTPRSDSKSLLMWAEWQPLEQLGMSHTRLLLAPMSMLAASPHYDYLTHLQEQRTTNERARLMYVAATRAERKLILTANLNVDDETGEPKAPPKTTLLSELWDTHQESFEFSDSASPLLETTEIEETQAQLRPLARLPDAYELPRVSDIDWQSHLPKMLRDQSAVEQMADEQDSDLEFEWAGPVAIAVGTLLHKWMENLSWDQLCALPDEIDFNHPLVASWRGLLKAQGFTGDALSYAMARLLKAITQMRTDATAEFVFKSRSSTKTELAVSAYIDNSLRQFSIDRTFIEDGTLWVVDHKTTDTRRTDLEQFALEQIESRHRKQLEGYGRLMHEIGGKPVQLAVYFPLLKQIHSWPFVP